MTPVETLRAAADKARTLAGDADDKAFLLAVADLLTSMAYWHTIPMSVEWHTRAVARALLGEDQ